VDDPGWTADPELRLLFILEEEDIALLRRWFMFCWLLLVEGPPERGEVVA
jgi:hypothetical protein